MVRRKNLELAKLAETAAERGRTPPGQRETSHPAQPGGKPPTSPGQGVKDPAAGRKRGRLVRAVNDLTDLLDATRRIAAQTRQRMAGTTPDGATRRVSLHDPDARPIAKGRLGKPVEFGAKAQVCDNADGIVLDHDVQPGNPADAPRLKPAVERVKKRTGQDAPDRRRRPRLRRSLRRRRPDRPRDPQRRDPPQRPTHQGPTSPRTTSKLPAEREMADRLRRPDQSPETQLRLGPHHDRHHRRSPDLDRTGSLRPQPHQDRHPDRLTPTRGPLTPAAAPSQISPTHRIRPIPTNPTSSGRSSES